MKIENIINYAFEHLGQTAVALLILSIVTILIIIKFRRPEQKNVSAVVNQSLNTGGIQATVINGSVSQNNKLDTK